jgi:hypothetical protein
MKPLRYAVFLLAPLAAVYADVVVPNGPWQTVTTPVTTAGKIITSSVNTNGTSDAYWNNATMDSATDCLNIGCFVVGDSGLPNSPTLGNPVYLGNDDGSAVTDFYWSTPVAGPTFSALLGELVGRASSNWIGWYEQGAVLTTANRGTAWDVIFDGADSTGANVSFTPTANFGLWFLSNFSAGPATDDDIVAAFGTIGKFTESSRNNPGAGATNQYFASFARSAMAANTLPADFWVGVEDVNFANGADRDYNDMMLSLQLVVPEPGYYAILAILLFGIVVAHRRRYFRFFAKRS